MNKAFSTVRGTPVYQSVPVRKFQQQAETYLSQQLTMVAGQSYSQLKAAFINQEAYLSYGLISPAEGDPIPKYFEANP